MALQQIPPIRFTTMQPTDMASETTSLTLDAVGESAFLIGRVRLQGGSGSKVLSAAGGGRIHWRTGSAITFANAGTTIRVGIQDVGSTGIEDGTFDVYADLVGGTDTLAIRTSYRPPAEVGTKTIAHGDRVAIGVEMLSRGGADSVSLTRITNQFRVGGSNRPYITADSGAGPAKLVNGMAFLLEFDDGTVGWIEGLPWSMDVTGITATGGFSSSSTPDEYCGIIRFPFACEIGAIGSMVGQTAAADLFDHILYSDPLGTPIAERTVSVDPNFWGGASGGGPEVSMDQITPYVVTANTDIGIAVRPSTTNVITYGYISTGVGFGAPRKKTIPSVTGTVILASRSNQTGAFTEVDADHIPAIYLLITALDDGSGGGAGAPARIFGSPVFG